MGVGCGRLELAALGRTKIESGSPGSAAAQTRLAAVFWHAGEIATVLRHAGTSSLNTHSAQLSPRFSFANILLSSSSVAMSELYRVGRIRQAKNFTKVRRGAHGLEQAGLPK